MKYMTDQPISEELRRMILLARGHKVMLSGDLAKLFGVAPRALIQAVKRNIERFPTDIMFSSTIAEVRSLRSQIVIFQGGFFFEGGVTFSYRDRRAGDTLKSMTIPAEEFIRRFLLQDRRHDRRRRIASPADECLASLPPAGPEVGFLMTSQVPPGRSPCLVPAHAPAPARRQVFCRFEGIRPANRWQTEFSIPPLLHPALSAAISFNVAGLSARITPPWPKMPPLEIT